MQMIPGQATGPWFFGVFCVRSDSERLIHHTLPPLSLSITYLTMSGITLVNQVKASKFLSGVLQPVANAFVNAAGYRKLGASLFSPSIFILSTFTIFSERVS
jgi:hypothetical protein